MFMVNKHLHIISFDIPYPATYGGAIDVFFRIQSLAKLGVSITLHCFYKGELHHYPELESLCRDVYYYPRKTSWKQMLQWRPYAVVSRTSANLLPRLLQDNDPILFEGLVSCALLDHPLLARRNKYVRECNIEHTYFHALGKDARSLGNKLYYYIDALRLRFFENKVRYATAIFSIAHQDEQHFLSHYPKLPVIYLPASHPNSQIIVPEGLGQYVLYHGNLDVAENYDAARIIACNIAPRLPDLQFIIAGRYHNHVLDGITQKLSNVQLLRNPDEQQMKELITDAQIHLLITQQATGLKLKLLNVLYQGRHVIVNDKMVTGTDVLPLCHLGHNIDELVALCRKYYTLPISNQERKLRAETLSAHYDNQTQGNKIIQYIFQP